MGSDAAMEKITTATYGRWEMDGNEQVFNVYRRSSYDNTEHHMLQFSSDDMDNLSTRTALSLTLPIPERPEPVLSPAAKVRNVLRILVEPYEIEYFDDNDWLDVAEEIVKALND